jgi:hypothetical protein
MRTDKILGPLYVSGQSKLTSPRSSDMSIFSPPDDLADSFSSSQQHYRHLW